jgi:outer membrane immunogenic protein
MKQILIGTAAALALMTGAATTIAAPFNSSYIGANVGYSQGDANQTNFSAAHGGALTLLQNDASLSGLQIGLLAGHNFTIGTMVVGVEGNWDFSGPWGDDAGSGGDINEWSQNWEASLRARVGVLVSPNSLVYATGGYSWADYEANVLNPTQSSRSNSFGGWTVGIGGETTVSTNMTIRLQYRYTDYSAERVNFGPAELYDIQAGPTINAVTAGLAYHF